MKTLWRSESARKDGESDVEWKNIYNAHKNFNHRFSAKVRTFLSMGYHITLSFCFLLASAYRIFVFLAFVEGLVMVTEPREL